MKLAAVLTGVAILLLLQFVLLVVPPSRAMRIVAAIISLLALFILLGASYRISNT